ncbi:MAG: SMC-Scp complex subunit ScpB [Gammaproteobacteria bacterium]|nr:SMC-Scp complex subunit ScpB [Gammaproteobacteria bacterium]
MVATTTVHTQESIKNIVEAAILAANKAISLDKILTLFPKQEIIDKNSLRQAIDQLMADYQSRGVELVEVSSGFRFQVAQTAAPWVSRLWEEKPQKYSRALLETLALIAYRQPITRGEIEEIRGVSVSSQIMRTLVEREWVRIIGHRDVPGKPAIYATTRQFLDYFGLKKLDELPTLAEIRDLDTINAELDFGDDSDNSTSASDKLENTQQDDSLAIEEDMLKSSDTDERIDIDVELNALSETYKQIDSTNAAAVKVDETAQKSNITDSKDVESSTQSSIIENQNQNQNKEKE